MTVHFAVLQKSHVVLLWIQMVEYTHLSLAFSGQFPTSSLHTDCCILYSLDTSAQAQQVHLQDRHCVLQLLLELFQPNGSKQFNHSSADYSGIFPKWTLNNCFQCCEWRNLIIQDVADHLSCKSQLLWSTLFKFGETFKHSVSMVRIPTECITPGLHQMSPNKQWTNPVSIGFTGRSSSDPVKPVVTHWLATREIFLNILCFVDHHLTHLILPCLGWQ